MTSLVVFLYRIALLGLPAGFRNQYGESMVEEVQLGLEEAARRGWLSHLVATGRLGVDFLATCAREWGTAVAEWFNWRQPGVFADVRFAVRSLGRAPAFTVTVLLTLGLGIGASAALFSAVDAVLLRTLPVPDPERLVLLGWSASTPEMAGSVDDRPVVDPISGVRRSRSFSMMAYERFRDSGSGLSSVFAFARIEQLNAVVDGDAEVSSGQFVSGDYHGGLGVTPALGRGIGPDDDLPAATPVAVLSHRYWERRFGLAPDVIGRTVDLNGVAFTIVGVTPAAFSGTLEVGESPDFSVPLAFEPALRPGDSNMDEPWNWWLFVMGRLDDGAEADAVAAEIEGLFHRTALDGWDAMPPTQRSRPEFQGSRALPRLEVMSGSQGLGGARETYARRLRILTGMVLGLMLIVWANVAGLLLVRAETRRGEIAVRRALGASRAQIVRQLGTEGLLLSVLAALLGVIVAYWGKDALLAWLPLGSRELALQAWVNTRLLGFAAALSVATSMVIGALPAITATSRQRATQLRGAGRGTSRAIGGLRGSMVVGQVSLSFVLLTLAGLFVGTLRSLERVELGFDPSELLLFRVDPRLAGYEQAEIPTLYERLSERLEAVPGVRSVTLSRHPLLAGSYERTGDGVFVHGPGPEIQEGIPYVHRIRWNFFAAMETPIVAGRPLTAGDDGDTPRVAVVNERFARSFFPTDDPIGYQFSVGSPTDVRWEIVGVVRDAKYTGQRDAVPPTIYVAYTQAGTTQVNFALRTADDPSALIPAVRAAIRELDPDLPTFEMRTQVELARQRLSPERGLALLSSSFGLVALFLTCLALYGSLSYQVARRTREIGIRMALGAPRRRVMGSVLGGVVSLVAVGLLVGLPVAHVSARLISEQLFGLAAGAIEVRLFAALAMLGVAALAAYLPARRASRVDPVVALGSE